MYNHGVDSRQLRLFVTVAEELHFGRAAQRLHTAQPALSQAIKRLEQDIGVPLFTRTTRSVTLTAAGQALYEQGTRILTAMSTAVEDARRAYAGEIGTLSVGCTTLAPHHLLPRLAASYRVLYPTVRLMPDNIPSALQVQLLGRAELDAGLLWRASAEAKPDYGSVSYRTLVRQALVVAVPDRHPLAEEKKVRLTDISSESLVTYRHVPVGSVLRSVFWRTCTEAGFTPRVVQEAPDAYSILCLVAAGIGITLMPECISEMPMPGVKLIPIARHKPPLEFVLAWRSDDERALLRGLLDVVMQLEGNTA